MVLEELYAIRIERGFFLIQGIIMHFYSYSNDDWASQAVLMIKNLPAKAEVQDMRVQSLGQEDSLEDGMEPHSIILAWKIPQPEEPGKLQSMGPQRVRHG